MLQNGSTPFVHPVTHRLIGPYEFYEGNAHQEHENTAENEPNKEDELKNDSEDQITEDNSQKDGGISSEEDTKQPEDGKPKGKRKPKEEG